MTTIHKTTALDITFATSRTTGKLHINTPLRNKSVLNRWKNRLRS